jgi:hypothetical protein
VRGHESGLRRGVRALREATTIRTGDRGASASALRAGCPAHGRGSRASGYVPEVPQVISARKQILRILRIVVTGHGCSAGASCAARSSATATTACCPARHSAATTAAPCNSAATATFDWRAAAGSAATSPWHAATTTTASGDSASSVPGWTNRWSTAPAPGHPASASATTSEGQHSGFGDGRWNRGFFRIACRGTH